MTTVTVSYEAKLWDWPYQHDDGLTYLKDMEDYYVVGLDCAFFLPHEIEVKCYEGEVIIHCRHQCYVSTHSPVDEHVGHHHSGMTREVTRSYRLPPDVDTATLKSSLKMNGTLIITADKKKKN